jgi:hypothetical protein
MTVTVKRIPREIKKITVDVPTHTYESFRNYCKNNAIDHKVKIEQLVNTYMLNTIEKK